LRTAYVRVLPLLALLLLAASGLAKVRPLGFYSGL